MPAKMLGQIAFEAYVNAVGGQTYDGQPIPGWEDLSGDGDKTRAAWQHAANAVLTEADHRWTEAQNGVYADEARREIPG